MILTFTTPENRWLSNMTLVDIRIGGITYPSTENAYQSMKYMDSKTKHHISTLSPHESKKFSRDNKMTNKSFDDDRLQIMTTINRIKYEQEPFRSMLIATGDQHIEEGNYWNDTFWGTDINTRTGLNHLGKIIMNIRSDLNNLNDMDSFKLFD